MGRATLAAQKLLLFNEIRIPFGLMRYFFYRYVARNLRTWGGPELHLGRRTFIHNFNNVRRSLMKHDRVLHMVWPLLGIEKVAIYRRHMKTLSIGPRSEGELLLIAAHGFPWANIRGVDLFSYSPHIDVADMHRMPYADNTFDVVFSGWVLGYSDDRARALKEMVRVLKPGGYVAFGQGHSRVLNKAASVDDNWVGASVRSNDIDGIFAPIADHIDRFYFRHEITSEMAANGQRAILAVFSIKK
jgi:SAM-dependent methyltransferase